MRILVDAAIPFARESFEPLGEVVTYEAGALTPREVRSADVLLVRSVTRVDPNLLDGSAVRFVGTASSGSDHVDTEYLGACRIAFADARGCNANSVAEYVVAALLALADRDSFHLSGMTLGIVGLGHAGRQVRDKVRHLGMMCIANDPPLARITADPMYRPLEEALSCDVVSLHVPLTRTGPDRTYHLIDAGTLSLLRPESILINTARGGVIESRALLRTIREKRLRACVLDVWENEPVPDPGLVELADIATPHIAGHSSDARAEATRMLHVALCRRVGRESFWDPEPLLPKPETDTIAMRDGQPNALHSAVRTAYDIMADDARTRTLIDCPQDRRAGRFRELRVERPVRREFRAHTVTGGALDARIAERLSNLGFRVRQDAPLAHGG